MLEYVIRVNPFGRKGSSEVDRAQRAALAALFKHNDMLGVAKSFASQLFAHLNEPTLPNLEVPEKLRVGCNSITKRFRNWLIQQRQLLSQVFRACIFYH